MGRKSITHSYYAIVASLAMGSAFFLFMIDSSSSAFYIALSESFYVPYYFLAGYLIFIHYLAYTSIVKFKKEVSKNTEQIRKITHFDSLTSLPNRTLLKAIIDAAIVTSTKESTLLAVCCIDLDGFKKINEIIGSNNGDKLLISIAENLSLFAGKNAVGRIGGDEFVVLLRGFSKQEALNNSIKELLSIVQLPCLGELSVVKPTASIGVAVYPTDTSSCEVLIRRAGIAMFDSKLKGKNQYQVFDSEKNKFKAKQNGSIGRTLKAIRSGEMSLYYQPKMNIKDKTIVGFEALIRWNHPGKGILLPGEFLPSLNDCECIVELDEWVLNESFRQLERWRKEGFETTVSVNITSQSILLPGFIKTVESICKKYNDIPVESIHFEVLETTVLEDIQFAKSQLSKLRELGIKVALDDFGTGYSSLGYLRNLPTDYIKIDQSFIGGIISDEGDQAIVESLVRLSKAFKIKVVAEGVEDANTLSKLLLLECDIAQGYYLSKPMPSIEVVDWIRNESWMLVN